MSRAASNGTPNADEPTANSHEPNAGTDDSEATASEYEHLRTKKKERQGNTERAEVRDVFVGEGQVVLTIGFEWTTETVRRAYDLDDDRDVLELESLAESRGFAFEQVSFLEGEPLEVVYTGWEWVPETHLASVEGEGSATETFATELRLLVRELARSPTAIRRLVCVTRTVSTRQVILAIVVAKKLLAVALVAWLLL